MFAPFSNVVSAVTHELIFEHCLANHWSESDVLSDFYLPGSTNLGSWECKLGPRGPCDFQRLRGGSDVAVWHSCLWSNNGHDGQFFFPVQQSLIFMSTQIY